MLGKKKRDFSSDSFSFSVEKVQVKTKIKTYPRSRFPVADPLESRTENPAHSQDLGRQRGDSTAFSLDQHKFFVAWFGLAFSVLDRRTGSRSKCLEDKRRPFALAAMCSHLGRVREAAQEQLFLQGRRQLMSGLRGRTGSSLVILPCGSCQKLSCIPAKLPGSQWGGANQNRSPPCCCMKGVLSLEGIGLCSGGAAQVPVSPAVTPHAVSHWTSQPCWWHIGLSAHAEVHQMLCNREATE